MAEPMDVPPAALLSKLATELKRREGIRPPAWSAFVRTSVHAQQAPTQSEWWYLRSASVLRKVYMKGHIGGSRLSAEYGGKKDRGSAPYHARRGSRSIAREILQQLEKAGLVESKKERGRRVSAAGNKLLATTARDVLKELAEKDKSLAKYL